MVSNQTETCFTENTYAVFRKNKFLIKKTTKILRNFCGQRRQ